MHQLPFSTIVNKSEDHLSHLYAVDEVHEGMEEPSSIDVNKQV
jgi:hypothetical protein